MDDASDSMQSCDGGDGDGDPDFGAADAGWFDGDQGDGDPDDGADTAADDWADGDGSEGEGDDGDFDGDDGGDDGWGAGDSGQPDENGDGASEDSLAGATADYSAYEPSPYQIRHTNSAAEIAAFAAMDTVGAAGDGALSLLAHGVGGVAGLLGNDQDAANWHDLGNKELENARASARNAMRDVGAMEGDREVRPYPDGHDQCPVPHGS
jgi:hypothetical protein